MSGARAMSLFGYDLHHFFVTATIVSLSVPPTGGARSAWRVEAPTRTWWQLSNACSWPRPWGHGSEGMPKVPLAHGPLSPERA